MKRAIIVFFIFLITIPSWSQNETTSIAILIEDGLVSNSAEISRLAAKLSDAQRFLLIHEYKKDPTLPFIANFFLGCGIGSFIQDDRTGGIIALLGDISGAALMVAGSLVPTTGQITSIRWSQDLGKNPIFLGMYLGGTGILLGSRIFEMIRPWTYSSGYNKKLLRALSNQEIGFMVQPDRGSIAASFVYTFEI
ncbi:MAG TPA: P13 family porin [Dehalococcoidia bacterium]|nr:P13 family porin [Dehalococcoidia bacterium]